jgi:hypothetical protein
MVPASPKASSGFRITWPFCTLILGRSNRVLFYRHYRNMCRTRPLMFHRNSRTVGQQNNGTAERIYGTIATMSNEGHVFDTVHRYNLRLSFEVPVRCSGHVSLRCTKACLSCSVHVFRWRRALEACGSRRQSGRLAGERGPGMRSTGAPCRGTRAITSEGNMRVERRNGTLEHCVMFCMAIGGKTQRSAAVSRALLAPVDARLYSSGHTFDVCRHRAAMATSKSSQGCGAGQ